MIDAHAQVRRMREPLFTRVDDDLLGLDTHAGLAYGLNPSAARVWQLIEQWVTVEQLCEQLRRVYDVTPDTCLRQVVALLEQLGNAGLIEVSASHPDHP